MMIPIYPPKVFKIISSISQNLYGIKPWINSTPKVIINTAKRVLVLFFSNLMYIKNPKGINKTIYLQRYIKIVLMDIQKALL